MITRALTFLSNGRGRPRRTGASSIQRRRERSAGSQPVVEAIRITGGLPLDRSRWSESYCRPSACFFVVVCLTNRPQFYVASCRRWGVLSPAPRWLARSAGLFPAPSRGLRVSETSVRTNQTRRFQEPARASSSQKEGMSEHAFSCVRPLQTGALARSLQRGRMGIRGLWKNCGKNLSTSAVWRECTFAKRPLLLVKVVI